MSEQMQLSESTKRLLLTRYPHFGQEFANITIEYNEHLKYHTAATDGKKIYLDPHYFASLDDEGRLFLLAHEIMHIKFWHMFRLEKDGVKRDIEVWNEATDAIINANLKRDGFTIKKGYVNIPDALKYSAEELYEILLKEKEEKKKQTNEKENSDTSEISEDVFKDDHTMWEEAFEKQREESSNKNEKETKTINENQEFMENRKERMKRAKENYEQMREESLKKQKENENSSTISLGNIGEENSVLDWRILLRREIEKSETIWSQRRSIMENNYAYRLEENDLEEDAETEVQIDVSGSVDLTLVKSFLRMIKPIVIHSKLKVGCFNEKFWGWTEIKTMQDIDNFSIPAGARGHSSWTEDWDLAVRSFTKKKEINKIIFTDGYPGPGNMPKEDLKNENVLWIVYGNKDFHPCCGKVIQITESQLKQMHCENEWENFGKSR